MDINLNCHNNKLYKEGNLDEQIVDDLERFIEERNEFQREHLDKMVRDTYHSHHYDEWTEENQMKIKYAQRILDCLKTQMKA